MAGAFLVPFALADQLGLQRDVYYALYVAFAVALFIAWARDTSQSPREMVARRWKLAVGLGFVFALVGALLVTKAENFGGHPGGIELFGALVWRGLIYGAADGLLLSAFPMLLVFAAMKNSRARRRPRRRRRGRHGRVVGHDRRLPRRLQRLPLRQAAPARDRRLGVERPDPRHAEPHRSPHRARWNARHRGLA
jgi:hypothetical protein